MGEILPELRGEDGCGMKEYICIESPNEVEGGLLVREQELIRCKECKYRDKETANCTRFRKDWYVQSNSFCSWAEPKETES